MMRRNPFNDPERALEPPEQTLRCCPICGAEEPETIIQEPGGRVLGCDECLIMRPLGDWFNAQRKGRSQ